MYCKERWCLLYIVLQLARQYFCAGRLYQMGYDAPARNWHSDHVSITNVTRFVKVVSSNFLGPFVKFVALRKVPHGTNVSAILLGIKSP